VKHVVKDFQKMKTGATTEELQTAIE